MNLIKLFKEVKPILDKYALDYWLDAGTLLGFIRSGAILPGDKDIDLGTYYEPIPDVIPHLSKDLAKKNLEVQVNDSKISIKGEDGRLTIHLYKNLPDEHVKNLVYKKRCKPVGNALNYLFLDGLSAPYQDTLMRKPKNVITLSFKRLMLSLSSRQKQKWYNIVLNVGLTLNLFKFYHLSYPKAYFNFLKPVSFYGETVNIPKLSDSYLEYCYGPNWRIPDRNFPEDGYYQVVSSHAEVERRK